MMISMTSSKNWIISLSKVSKIRGLKKHQVFRSNLRKLILSSPRSKIDAARSKSKLLN